MLWLAAIFVTVVIGAAVFVWSADAHDENAAMREFAAARDAHLQMWRDAITNARKEDVEV